MKKIIVMLGMLLCITAIGSFAQTEVKGLETRRVIYNGPSYGLRYSGTSTKYYGWEIVNHNSITVSVEAELWCHSDDSRIVKSQDIILKSGERYIFKREEHSSTHVDYNDSDFPISSYYIKCKAYKLE